MRSLETKSGYHYGVRHLLANKEIPLSEFISNELQIEIQRTKDLVEIGAVYVNQSRTLLERTQLKKGDLVRVHTEPRRYLITHLNPMDRIIAENADYVVVNKSPGIPVHATVDNAKENLLALIENHIQSKLFVTHRLDIPTSGLIVYAKNKEFQKWFNTQLFNRTIKKQYRALTSTPPQTGLLIHYMMPSSRAPKIVNPEYQIGWNECRLNIFESQRRSSNCTEIQIELITGRTHQIRAQLGAIGSPIWGDLDYGGSSVTHDSIHFDLLRKFQIQNLNGIALQCSHLDFGIHHSYSI